MFITRKKYEEDLAIAKQEGMDEAWSTVRTFIKNIVEEEHESPECVTAVHNRLAMISQPMGGKEQEEIAAVRERTAVALRELGYDVADTLFDDKWYDEESARSGNVVNRSLFFLAKSLEAMSKCRAVCFCKGWNDARGCRIEHDAAVEYGLEIIFEE